MNNSLFDNSPPTADNMGELDSPLIGQTDQVLAPDAIKDALDEGRRPDPSKLLEEEREGGRVPLGRSLKLTFNDQDGQLDGFCPRWVSTRKLEASLRAGYTPVFKNGVTVGEAKVDSTDMGSWVSNQSGPSRLYLMKLPQSLRDLDLRRKAAVVKKTDDAIKGGMLDDVDNPRLKANVQIT